MRTPTRLLCGLGLGLGLLFSSAACDDPEPTNECLEFLTCYAECRDEQNIPDCPPDPGNTCNAQLGDGSAADIDHERCSVSCDGSTGDWKLYPLSNEYGYTWGFMASCLRS